MNYRVCARNPDLWLTPTGTGDEQKHLCNLQLHRKLQYSECMHVGLCGSVTLPSIFGADAGRRQTHNRLSRRSESGVFVPQAHGCCSSTVLYFSSRNSLQSTRFTINYGKFQKTTSFNGTILYCAEFNREDFTPVCVVIRNSYDVLVFPSHAD
jgi:hypothetical protein